MSEQRYTSTMTRKGQVTIPAAIRRMLKQSRTGGCFEVERGATGGPLS
jgi:bifunctional DNA-binding transcriptional regulator/antitoxin component of YhaV-PrlF toxin-antitoxin module